MDNVNRDERRPSVLTGYSLRKSDGAAIIARCEQIVQALKIEPSEARLATHVGVLEGQIKAMCAQYMAPSPKSLEATVQFGHADLVAHFSLDEDGDILLDGIYANGLDIHGGLSNEQLAEIIDQIEARRTRLIDDALEYERTEHKLWVREGEPA